MISLNAPVTLFRNVRIENRNASIIIRAVLQTRRNTCNAQYTIHYSIWTSISRRNSPTRKVEISKKGEPGYLLPDDLPYWGNSFWTSIFNKLLGWYSSFYWSRGVRCPHKFTTERLECILCPITESSTWYRFAKS